MKIFIALACAFLLPELTNGNLGFGGNQGNFYHGIGGQLSGLSGNGNQYISQPYTSPYIPDPYEHFCQYFYDLRSINQGNNLDAVIHQEILKAIFQMGRRLEMEIPGFNVFQAPKLEDAETQIFVLTSSIKGCHRRKMSFSILSTMMTFERFMWNFGYYTRSCDDVSLM